MGRHKNDGLFRDGTNDTAVDEPVEKESPRRPRWWPLPLAAAVVFAALLATLMLQIHDMREQMLIAERNSEVLADQVEELGGVPRVSPSAGPPGQRGVQGEQGDPGRAPTSAEIQAAVAAYLRAHPPANGRAPKSTEIAAAVTAYLQEHPPARGPAGEKGEPGVTVTGPAGPKGDPGEDSTVPGPQGERGEPGPPPSAEQVSAAVEAWLREHPIYCYPPDAPGQVTGQPWRCTVTPP